MAQGGTNIMRLVSGVLLGRHACLPGAVAVVIATALHSSDILSSARADVTIHGGVDAVRLEARDSSIAEVLATLGQSFSLQYPKLTDLDRPVSGSFEGPLSQVISQVLKGYDYILKSSEPDRMEILLIRSSSPNAHKAPVVPAPANVQSPPAGLPAPNPYASASTLPFRPPPSYSRTIQRTPAPGQSAAASPR
jgi:hypothetical protein